MAAALYQQVNRPPEQPVASGATAAADEPSADPTVSDPFVLPPIAAFAQIVQRPVFSPTRRPPSDAQDEPEIADAAPSRRDPLDVVVVGIITGPREIALLRSTSSDRLVPLAEGETLSGWTLTDIEPFRLVFRREDDERIVELEFREE